MDTKLFSFIVKYEGVALDTHTINATHLANALLGLSTALETINASSNPDSVRMNLRIHALKQGSFGIEFLLEQNILSQVASIFTGVTVSAIVNAYTLVHLFLDLCNLAKVIRGRSISKVEHDSQAGTTSIEIEGETIQAKTIVFNLYANQTVNQSIKQFFTPLSEDGVEKVSFIDQQETTSFTKEDVAFICEEQNERILTEDVQKRVLTILTASFKDGSKWKVSTGDGSSYYASISDLDFINRVDTGEELFAKHDILVVDLKTTQSLSSGKLKTEYDIIKVHEHKRMPEQLTLV